MDREVSDVLNKMREKCECARGRAINNEQEDAVREINHLEDLVVVLSYLLQRQ